MYSYFEMYFLIIKTSIKWKNSGATSANNKSLHPLPPNLTVKSANLPSYN